MGASFIQPVPMVRLIDHEVHVVFPVARPGDRAPPEVARAVGRADDLNGRVRPVTIPTPDAMPSLMAQLATRATRRLRTGHADGRRRRS